MTNPTPTYVKEAAEEIIEHLSLCETSDVKEYTFARDRIESILLKHLPQPSEWVDVRDRLPEQNKHVLVHVSSLLCSYVARLDCGDWYLLGASTPYIKFGYNVSFWMPLPQPPAQKESA